jgi:hypothetical protein
MDPLGDTGPVGDPLQIELLRSIDGDRFEGTGSVPIPEDGTGVLGYAGEVREGTPRRICSNLTAIAPRIEVER